MNGVDCVAVPSTPPSSLVAMVGSTCASEGPSNHAACCEQRGAGDAVACEADSSCQFVLPGIGTNVGSFGCLPRVTTEATQVTSGCSQYQVRCDKALQALGVNCAIGSCQQCTQYLQMNGVDCVAVPSTPPSSLVAMVGSTCASEGPSNHAACCEQRGAGDAVACEADSSCQFVLPGIGTNVGSFGCLPKQGASLCCGPSCPMCEDYVCAKATGACPWWQVEKQVGSAHNGNQHA